MRAQRIHSGKGGKWRRRGLALACILAVLLPVGLTAQDITFFRIGTGSTSGTYFPIGGIIASAISKPPGSRDCAVGGSCGVPGLIAVVQSTEGSVANVLGIGDGTLESGLSQADISFWAFRGEANFKKTGAVHKLRAIANLFPEAVHLVVRRDSNIESVADLRGKTISFDREGSGTRVDALLILKAYGLALKDITAEAQSLGTAVDLLREGKLDGFFIVAGTPAAAVVELANDSLIRLIPISGVKADKLRAAYPFFAADRIAAGTYLNVPVTETLSVGAQWLVSADVPDDLVYGITKALWAPSTRRLLDNGHPKGQLITVETALEGLAVPLHPGARRYYEEAGIPIPATAAATAQ
ncbi:MAG TPA: TAXI family TRAP transporter solute-binding subunit [Kiloniellales bacterium]